MKQGDFTLLAKDYIHRPGYSLEVLTVLAKHIGAFEKTDFAVADIGAGTGKLTENLIQIGLAGYAVEPNDAMREEGILLNGQEKFAWLKGPAEELPLPDSSVDWVLMASAFHWTKPLIALREFHRILKPEGFFTALWNPRHLEDNEIQQKIDAKIKEMVPDLKRVSSGARIDPKELEKSLLQEGLFKDIIFIEAPHKVSMSKDRYMGAWRSVNDIQAQAGPQTFQEILQMISNVISHLTTVDVPYRTRAWTVQSTKG